MGVFGFEVMEGDDRFCAFRVGEDVLLLFTEDASAKPIKIAGGVIPPHETRGVVHFALGIDATTLEVWRTRLVEQGVAIESEVTWERGGSSLYFRDPDDNLVELVTPGTWANY